jgi:hypothetical protein
MSQNLLGGSGRLPEGLDALIEEGLKRAALRCRQDMPQPDEAQTFEAFGRARELMGHAQDRGIITEWHPRAVMLFVEVIAVGVYARAIHEEAAMNKTDLVVFADWLKKILNDWVKD